jgi:peptidoglycan/LPS O-acetylase OafA/YrhL
VIYRPEIDGLRAIAVVSVMLFHGGFSIASGGFAGVDIFFVISGYLITTIILSELDAENFSIIRFYERRARRILPALFFVLFFCLPFAWFWLLPQDIKNFSQSLVAVSLFASNILYWRTSGYFDTTAELKPLLHTWSLAVEEQYYTIFPVFLMLAWRFAKQHISLLMTIIACISLAAAQWASASYPDAAFYLLPTRGWELLIGAISAYHISNKKLFYFNNFTREIGSLIGLLLITYSILFYTKQTPFPSIYALSPTIGAALIIIFTNNSTIAGKILCNRILVGIGLISYSTYLWHQPLLSFARHKNLNEPDQFVLVILIIASMFLGYISWKYIESPFRDKNKFTKKNVFAITIIGSTFFASLGLFGSISKKMTGPISKDQIIFLDYFDNTAPEWQFFSTINLSQEFRKQCDFYDMKKYLGGVPTKIPVNNIANECYVRSMDFDRSLFIWGDSHAQQLYSGLKRGLPSNWQILQVASSGCVAKITTHDNNTDYCEHSNWFAINKITEIKPDVVIIAQNMMHDPLEMKKVGAQLKMVGIKKIIFVGPSPHWTADLPKIIVYKLWEKTPTKTFIGIDEKIATLDRKLKKEFVSSENEKFISMIDYFCNQDGCDVYYGDSIKTGITSWDYGHLTPLASYKFSTDILVNEIIH